MATASKDSVRKSANVGKDLESVLRTDTGRGGDDAASTQKLSKRPTFATVEEIFAFLNGMTLQDDSGRFSSSFSENTASTDGDRGGKSRLSMGRSSRSFRDSAAKNASVACIQYSFLSDPSATRFLTIAAKDQKVQVVATTNLIRGESPAVQLKFATLQDYVDLWNEDTRAVDLAMRGKLTLRGDRTVARLLSAVMDAARQMEPQAARDSARTAATSKTRQSSLFCFPSFSSTAKSESFVVPTEVEAKQTSADAFAVSNDQALLEEEYDREFERLQMEVEMLEQKCARLEVQNIVTATQQLDFLCRFLAMAIACGILWLYWKVLWSSSPWLEAHVLEHSSETLELPPSVLLLARFVMASLPFVHHWFYSGLAYRRIHVFCVAFLMMLRIRMTRWRSELFAKQSAIVRGNLGRSNGQDDGPQAFTPSFGQCTEDDDIWEANYEINARFLYVSILKLRGLWTKSAQYMSSRADFMPTSYVRELAKLQDEAPSTPWPVVKKILQRDGVYHHLTDMEETPIASASIGQVHVARLARTGEKVVVKVQHPHARRLLSDDFISLHVIARIISILEPEWKFLEILINEWAKEARRELDFQSEMMNLQTAHESAERFMSTCRPLRTNPTASSPEPVAFALEVPRPYKDLCTRDVLVMSFSEGKRVDDSDYLRQNGLSQDVVMDAVTQCFAYMLYSCPIFNGDPHPGNVFVRPNGEENGGGLTVVVLDWGLAKRLPDDKRKGFCQMAFAAATLDYGLMLDAFCTIGLRLKREDVGEDMENIRFLLRDIAPPKKARRRLKSKFEADAVSYERQKIPVESKAYPGEIFFFVRTNDLLHGLGSILGVDSSYMDTIKPYAERGLRAFIKEETKPPKQQVTLPPSVDSSLMSRVGSVLANLDKEGEIAGAQVCVVNKDGETVVRYCTGHMGGTRSHLPMTMDSVILGFSCTKAIAATLAHVMVQEGYLTYDEPLCERVWPKFCPFDSPPKELYHCWSSAFDLEQGWKWKRSVTLRHILSHTAGLATEFPPKLSLKTVGSCEECAKAYEYNGEDTLLPQDEPGTKCAYHFMTYGWILAGALMGAYQVRHQKREATFQEVYEKLLESKLPDTVLSAGFFPCGGHGQHPKAETQVDFNVGRLAQMQREAETVGDSTLEASDIDGQVDKKEEEEEEGGEGGNSADRIKKLRESFQGREFLMDPRMWNSATVEDANVPAAGGRFSATALAHFYHALGSGDIVCPEVLSQACTVQAKVDEFGALQGQTSADDFESSFGLGYQLITFDGERAFGHAGIGGSVGFYHYETGTAVGVMLNKYDADRGVALKIVRVLTDYVRSLK